MEENLKNKLNAAFARVQKLHEEAEPITFSRFGNDPSKSMAIPANMKKVKILLRKANQNLRLMGCSCKKLKALEQ